MLGNPIKLDGVGWRCCEHCGGCVDVELEGSRTMYDYEGPKGGPQDPNRPSWLCRGCAAEHHAYWDDLWSDYYTGLL